MTFNDKKVPAQRVHFGKDEKGTETLRVSSDEETPLVSVYLNAQERAKLPAQTMSAADKKAKQEQASKITGLIDQLSQRDFGKREAARSELIAMGPAALPHLARTLTSKATEENVKVLARSAIKRISTNEAGKALPESFMQEMKAFDADLFKVRLAASGVKALTDDMKKDFTQLIARADNSSSTGLDQEQARARLIDVRAEIKKVNDQLAHGDNNHSISLPLSSTNNASFASADAIEYLAQEPNRTLETKQGLLEHAAQSSGRIRAVYAIALSDSGNKAEAIKILKEAVEKDPGCVPSIDIQETDDDISWGMDSTYREDFVKAVKTSGALDNDEFLATFGRVIGENAETILEEIRDQQGN